MKKILFATFLVAFASGAYAQISFGNVDTLEYASSNFVSTFQRRSIFALDFNKDHFDDVIILRNNSIFLRLNNAGNGFLNEIELYENSESIYSLSNFVDLNNDTKLDVVMASRTGITTLLAGENVFIKSKEIAEAVSYGRLLVFDFNGDNKNDLLISQNRNIVMYSDVSSGFSQKAIVYTNDDDIYDFDFHDFNLDGRRDLVVSGYQSKLKILFSNSDNSFSIKFSKAVAGAMFRKGDLNLDGYPDIVYIHNNGNIYSLINNNSNSTFTDQAVFADVPANMYDFNLIDLDRNGTLDLLFNNFFDLSVCDNNGAGQFAPPRYLGSDAFSPYVFATLNYDNDGVDDVLVSDLGKFQVFMFNSQGDIRGKLEEKYIEDYRDVVYEDVDGDGRRDLVYVSASGAVFVRWGNVNGDFNEHSEYKARYNSSFLTIADIDDDGKKDFLVVESFNSGTHSIYAMRNNGNRQFGSPASWKLIPSSVKPLLLNTDSDTGLEIVTYEYYGNEVFVANIESQDYNEYQNGQLITIGGQGIIKMASADLNNDGFVDLMTANATSKNVSLLINDQAGNYLETMITPTGTILSVSGITAIDYNADQYPDIAVAVQTSASPLRFAVQVFLNDHHASFTYHTSHNLTDMYQPSNFTVTDIDHDGNVDFIISDWDNQESNVFHGENGIFIKKTNTSLKHFGQAARIIYDLNGDGKPDVFNATVGYGNTFIQWNNSVDIPGQVQTSIAIDNIDFTSVGISFGPSTSDERLVIITKGSTLSSAPVNDHVYASNLQFGIGSAIGENSYVVHAGSGQTLQITGLKSSTLYTISVFEYNVNAPYRTVFVYSQSSVRKSFVTPNRPPQISAVADQSSSNLETVIVPILAADEDNLLSELTYSATSSNQAVVPSSNLVFHVTDEATALYIQPVAEGESIIQLTVADTAHNERSISFYYRSIVVGITNDEVSSFTVYPNPFKNIVTIEGFTPDCPLLIYDSKGQMVAHFDNVHETIDLSNLKEGFYYFKMPNGKFAKVEKGR